MSAHGGGPAFPLAIAEIQGRATTANDFGPDMTGMTLRDYFAATAMQGLVLAMKWPAPSAAWTKALSEQAYGVADAMLAERAK